MTIRLPFLLLMFFQQKMLDTTDEWRWLLWPSFLSVLSTSKTARRACLRPTRLILIGYLPARVVQTRPAGGEKILSIFSILIRSICPYYVTFWMLHHYHHLDFASPLWDQHRASLDRFLFHCLGSSVQGGIGWRRKPLWNFQNIPIRQELPWLLFFDEDIFHAMMFVA